MNEIPSRKLLCKFYNFKDLKCRSHSDMNMKLIVLRSHMFCQDTKVTLHWCHASAHIFLKTLPQAHTNLWSQFRCIFPLIFNIGAKFYHSWRPGTQIFSHTDIFWWMDQIHLIPDVFPPEWVWGRVRLWPAQAGPASIIVENGVS